MRSPTRTVRLLLWASVSVFLFIGVSAQSSSLNKLFPSLFGAEGSAPNNALSPSGNDQGSGLSRRGSFSSAPGGPAGSLFAGPMLGSSAPAAARSISLSGTSFTPGQNGSITVLLEAQGDENAGGFSINFDISKLTYVSAVAGPDLAGATLNVNTLQLNQGHLGLAFALQTGLSMPAGTRHLATVTFNAAPNASGNADLTFGNAPIAQEVANSDAGVLPTDFIPASIPINLPPNPVPVLTNIAPDNATAGNGDLPMTVNGSNFVSTSVVNFGGTNLTTTFVDGGQLTAQIPAAALASAGNVSVNVFNPAPGGGTSNSLSFAINNPAPALTSLSPTSVTAGTGGTTLTVNGTGFVNGSVVRFAGSNRTTNFVSPTQLTAQLTSGDLAASGNFPITVQTAAPGGGTSNSLDLTVNNPVPAVTTLGPASVGAGGPAFSLTVNGSNFVANSVVKLNGASRTTTFVNSSQLTAAITAGDITTVGNVGVTVENPAPGGGASDAVNLVVENPVPVLVTFTPPTAIAGNPGFTLTVTGSNFVAGSVVQFAGNDRATTFVNSGQLTASILDTDIQNTGFYSINVLNPAPGGGASNSVNMLVNNPQPTLLSISPESKTAGETDFVLTVNGSSFVDGAVVRLNGTPLVTTFVNASQLTAQIPASDIGAAGVNSVTVQNPQPGGGISGSLDLTVNNPVPAVTTLAPTNVVAGGAAFALTVNGSNFVADSIVKLNGSARTTTVINSTQLTAAVTAEDITNVGSVAVMVENPAPGGGASNAVDLSVDNPVPVLTGFTPAAVNAGGSGFTLTVNGSNFVAGSVVQFAGTDRPTTFVNSGELTAAISDTDIQNTGNFAITVFSPAPGGGTSNAADLLVNNPPPILVSLSPDSKTAGEGDFVLTVNGSGFASGAVVRLNGAERVTTFVNATQLTAQIVAADIQTAGVNPITVENPAPGGGVSTSLDLTVNNPVPAVGALNPTNVVIGGAAFTLTVDGSNFVANSVVKINGSARATTFVNATQLTAAVTDADIVNVGNVAVTVENPAPGGGPSNAVNFSVDNPVPVLSSLTPTTVSAGGSGFTLTVNGSNFVAGSVVQFAGNNRPTTFVTSGELTAAIPDTDIVNTGNFAITVLNPAPGGGASNSVDLLVDNPPPTLLTISPASKTAGAADFVLTANGAGFVNGAVVRLNGAERVTTFVNSTKVTAQITAADVQAAGVNSITVENPAPGGGVSAALDLTVNNPVPAVSSLSPASLIAGSATFTLTVNGASFVDTSVVKLNGSARTTTFVNANQLTAEITAVDVATAGSLPITVENPPLGGGASNAVNLVVNNPVPVLSSLTPSSVNAGDAAFALAVNGSNFVATSVVRINGNNRPTTFIDSGQLTVQVPALDISSVGTLAVEVLNPAPGGGMSGSQSLTVNPPASGARAIRVLNVTSLAGSIVDVNIDMVAQGNENSWGFSLLYDSNHLEFLNAAIGPDVPTSSLLVNSTASMGHIGLAQSLPAGQSLTPGVRQILKVTFKVLPNTVPGTLPITFDDFPIAREVVNVNAGFLTTAYTSGVMTIAQGYEADVTPAPNGNTDGMVTIQDWAQVGRYMALLDSVRMGSEFQRTDCAPADGGGDGRLSVADWAQAGRYAAHLDPVPMAAGPYEPMILAGSVQMSSSRAEGNETVVRMQRIGSALDQYSVAISLDAKGFENAIGFSLEYDPTKLRFEGVEKQGSATEASLQINSRSTSKGRIGLALALPVNQSFTSGSQDILTVTFSVLAKNEDQVSTRFADLPIGREVVDVRARPVRAAFEGPKEISNPIDEPQYFVRQHYSDFLDRGPDTGGLDYWTDQIAECGRDERCLNDRRVRVSAAFFMEQEFQQTGYFIHRLYKVTLGRQPTYGEFTRERGQLVGAGDLEARKLNLVQSMLERLAGNGWDSLNNEQFVDSLLAIVQRGTGLDLSSERQNLITAGEGNRVRIVRTLVDNPGLLAAEYNSAFVLSEYFGYLRRDPDPEGYAFWLNVLNNRVPNNYKSMVCAFITSEEYQRRFGTVISHTNADCGP